MQGLNPFFAQPGQESAGFGPGDDVMPDCMKQDPIGPAKWVWDVPADVVADAYERFENNDALFELRS